MSRLACPACGHRVAARHKFCSECGTRLRGPTTSLPPAEEERRLVTILFADLTGSTAIAESIEPDALYELTHRVHERLERIVTGFEGHVARHLGDGLLVLFGAPTAHENDAERAVLAALAMQDEINRINADGHDPVLGMRIGITSGEVVAGHITGIYDIIGDAANVAARLQGAAPIGGILAGEETMRLAERRVRFGDKRELTLKGKARPVPAYPALGVRALIGERWEGHAGNMTRFVGRERELEAVLLTTTSQPSWPQRSWERRCPGRRWPPTCVTAPEGTRSTSRN